MIEPLAVRVVGASKTYDAGVERIKALDNVTFELPGGSLTAVSGVSGSGKSTLLLALAGLVELDSGSIHLGSVDISSLSGVELESRRRNLTSMIFQEYNLLPMLTAGENVALAARAHGAPAKLSQKMSAEALARVELSDQQSRYPAELSGGQRQRVAIARSLVGFQSQGSGVLLADEPTGALDHTTAGVVLAALRQATSHGITVVISSHDPAVWDVADQVIALRDGRQISTASSVLR